jgi:hypothetical protein
LAATERRGRQCTAPIGFKKTWQQVGTKKNSPAYQPTEKMVGKKEKKKKNAV